MMRWILPAWLILMACVHLDTPIFRAYGEVTAPFLFIGTALVSGCILVCTPPYRWLSRLSLLLYILFAYFMIRSAWMSPADSLLFPASLAVLLFYEACRQWLSCMDREKANRAVFAAFTALILLQVLFVPVHLLITQGHIQYIAYPNSSIYAASLAIQLVFYSGLSSTGLRPVWQGMLIIAVVIVLILLDGRAAWLGAGLSFFIYAYRRYVFLQRKRLIVLLCLISCLVFLALLRHKRDSSTGRVLIYKVSLQLLQQHFLWGAGPGRFATIYNKAQAAYFEEHDINGAEAMRAGNTVYAFHEGLQWWIEAGLIPVMFLLILLYLIFRTGFRSKDPLSAAATNALLCLLVISQFSYPLHHLPILLFSLFFLACVDIPGCREHILQDRNGIHRSLLIITSTVFVIIHFLQQWRNLDLSEQAFLLAASGEKKKACVIYQQLEKDRYSSGRTIYEYAKTTWDMADTSRAQELITKAKQKTTDAELLYLSGIIHEAAGWKDQAASEYIQAVRMFPSRMRYRYACFRLFKQQGKVQQAKYWASMILKLPFRAQIPYIIKVRLEAWLFLGEKSPILPDFGQK